MKPVNLNLTRIRILNPSPFVMHTSLDHEKLEVYQASLEFMLFGLIRANSDVRVFEDPVSYRAEKGQKGEGKSGNRKRNKSRSKNRNMR
jgi:hypothetical protein